MPDSPATLYVVDAHALIYRMFHALAPMTAPDGRPTNATFGFTRDLLTLFDEIRPDYLVCAFDPPGGTFRDTIFPDYKKTRPPAPDDLIAQIPMIQSIMEAMRVPVLGVPNYEADDVMATLAHHGHEKGIEVFLCTNDKDCRQLLTDRVRMYDLRKKTTLGPAELLADWGITPEQAVDFQALIGDSVDNVPGVVGVGEKTAAKLLQTYGTLDNLVAKAHEVKQAKQRENLKKAIESGDLERSRTLVRLERNVPMPLEWDQWKRQPWDHERLLALFEEFGFRSYAARVRTAMKSAADKVPIVPKNAELLAALGLEAPMPAAKPKGGRGLFDDPEEETPTEGAGDFAFGANAGPDTWAATYTLVNTPELFDQFLKDLKAQPRFCFDLETTGLDALQCDIVGLAFSWKAHEGYYLPVRGPAGDQVLPPEATLAALKPILEDAAVQKVNQNIKYDQLVLASQNIQVRGVAGDSMLAHYLLHSGERSHGLDELTRKYLAHENISITELIGKGKNQKTMDQVPVEKVCAYAAEDADAAWRLTELLEPQLAPMGVRELYDNVEVPLIAVLAEMEATGIRLDVPYLKRLSVQMAERLGILEKEIHEGAGKEFNIASLKQLRDVLYKDLKLPILKKTDLTGEPSTDQETLEKLAVLGHPVPKKIIEHRQISKLKGTYVDALPVMVNPKTNRVHTSFNQTVAATGRLSSSDPNLQNIPARTDLGREIRQAFIPQDGWRLVTADYSQIELRLLAHFSGDENLRAAYAENRDIHTQVAGEIFSVAPEAVTADMRRVAKTVNFGVIYGMSAHGLAERLVIDRKDADRFISNYFARYPAVLTYHDNLLRRAREHGYVKSILGRQRKFDPSAIRPKTSYQSRNGAEREAINMEIQASAADLMKLALLRVSRKLKEEKLLARMLLSVHDELVFEAPPAEVGALANLVRREMTGAMTLSVPLEVDVSAGPNWLEGEEVT
ncbi:DNA polymerase I [Zavarzinella formosa]|uniref:DNA polymerase I n=1 Tax=Zavarzinella formosa TaxID=360055 RepID=UPI0002D7B27F|nr:DNA polymerase I [Zavarzinella formosa]